MRQRSTEAGFTMVEVMVSVLITAIAAIGFIAMFMTETKAGAFTRHSTEASILATDKLEQLRTLTGATDSNDAVDAQGNPGGMYTRKWTLTNDVVDGITLYTKIVVQVGWNEDENVPACAVDTDCARSGFCMPSGSCAGRAVIVRGSRN